MIIPNKQPGVVEKLFKIVAGFILGVPAIRQLKTVKALYDDPARKPGVVGFKTKVRHIKNLKRMKAILESRHVRTIVMERKNFVKKAVAHIYAERLHEKTKQKYGESAWNLFDEKDRLGPQYISFEEFDQSLHRVIFLDRTLHAYADDLDVPKLKLEYADLLRDKDAWFRSIFDFLGVEPRQLHSRVLQNEPDDLRKALSNFEELRSHYCRTAFEPMFDEIV